LAVSKYEQYIVREPTRSKHKVAVSAWATVDNSRTAPPFMWMENSKPIAGVTHMVEHLWIWKDTAMGATVEKPPHKHDLEEIFLFLGTNKDDPNDLGADVELWMGEGKEADKINFSTSSLVWIPPGIAHMPLIYRNVKKPLILVIFALEAGEMRPKTVDCPQCLANPSIQAIQG
jgi:hypothetical protein